MHPLSRVAAGLAVILFVAGLAAQEKPAAEAGFTPLFNGQSLDGWHVMNKGQFSVRDGVIFQNKGGGWLRSDKEYKDFELRLDFRFLNKGADSGVFLRAGKDGANWPDRTYQVQAMDDNSLASVFASGGLKKDKEKKDADKLKKAMKPTGEWQSYVIMAQGTRLEVRLNGELVNVVDGLTDQAGYLGLQGEGDQLEWKNIRIKELGK